MTKIITLRDFLLTHSKIDESFILDFFDIQNMSKYGNHKPFIMDLDLIAIWLKSTKKDIKDTLLNSYIVDVDYKVFGYIPDDKSSNDNNKKKNGRPKELILLTTDCFKRLCMRSRTKMSEQVRTYFLQLEELVDEYKDYIIKTQEEKIRNLEYELNPDKLPEDGYFYVYEVGGLYRTGATKNLKLRFKTHNSSHSDTIKPILKIKSDNPFRLETCVNNLLAQYRIKKNKDFFDVNLLTILNAITDCEISLDKYKCSDCNIKLKSKELTSHLLDKHKDYNSVFTFDTKYHS